MKKIEKEAKQAVKKDTKPKETQIKEVEVQVKIEKKQILPRLLPTTKCFHITYTDSMGQTLALALSRQDMYFPKKTGVYRMYAAPLNNTDKAQLFAYDADKDTIKPHLQPK